MKNISRLLRKFALNFGPKLVTNVIKNNRLFHLLASMLPMPITATSLYMQMYFDLLVL